MNGSSSERIDTAMRSVSAYTNSKNEQQSSNEPVHLNEFEASLAMQLLRSVDERIASAARRIFSNVTTSTPHLAESITSTAQDVNNGSFQSATGDSNFNKSCDYETIKDTPLEKNASTETKSTSKKNLDAQASSERLLRSRERNRIHARRTRQRKKEHMQSLQHQIDELREEQMKLKQVINEKSTANILLDMCSSAGDHDSKPDDPEVDKLLKRPAEEIPTVPKANVLPALILPRQGKRGKVQVSDDPEENKSSDSVTSPMLQAQTDNKDDINYELLAKDRSACTVAELDKIRRERNRMHAKRTRDRKRILMEEMQGIIKKLEEENQKLKQYAGISSGSQTTESSPTPSYSTSTSDPPKLSVESAFDAKCTSESTKTASMKDEPQVRGKAISFHQLNSLLAAVTAFEEKGSVPESKIASKDNTDEKDDCVHDSKRLCLDGAGSNTSKLNSITSDKC